jgi:hypothetical protein
MTGFSVCESLVTARNWNCLTSCVGGIAPTDPGTFKMCLDGLVLAPWVTLSFLDITTDGCPSPCLNRVACSPCGTETCAEELMEQSGTLITVGNISQPDGNPIPLVDDEGKWTYPFWGQDTNDKCSAAIKSFQYQFENTGGATCKIVISDEQGSSFEYWINKTVKNIECAAKAYKMKIEFGWAALNPSDPENPSCFNDFTTSDDPCSVGCVPEFAQCNQDIITACTEAGRPCGTRIIARSGPLYFAPREIKPTLQNGRFIFEITGIDLMRMANEQTYSNTFPMNGVTDSQIRFRQAVEQLLEHATPTMDIQFLRLPRCPGEDIEDMQFFVPDGESHQIRVRRASNAPCNPGGPGPCDLDHPDCLPACTYEACTIVGGPNTDIGIPVNPGWACPNMFSAEDGPLGMWACRNKGLYDILKEWLVQVRADDGSCEGAKNGKGIVMNWDNRCPTPRVLMWADPFPTCKPDDIANRCIGTYIVNGGKCSPVVKFEPDMKWIFNAALRSGGNMTPSTGRARQMDNSGPNGGANQPTACQVSGGRMDRNMPTVPNAEFARGGDAQARAMQNTQANTRTNAIQGMLPVEATLVVQGDPTIGSVYESIGKTIGLVVINPFFIRDEDDIKKPFQRVPGCPYWDTLVRQYSNNEPTQQVINEVLTNKNWYIRGVSHSIKEGSFQTTYKIYLPVPGADISAGLPFGGAPDGFNPEPIGCFAPPGQNPDGANCDPDAECEGWACVPDCCNPDLSTLETYCPDDPNCVPQTPPLPQCNIPNPCPDPGCP